MLLTTTMKSTLVKKASFLIALFFVSLIAVIQIPAIALPPAFRTPPTSPDLPLFPPEVFDEPLPLEPPQPTITPPPAPATEETITPPPAPAIEETITPPPVPDIPPPVPQPPIAPPPIPQIPKTEIRGVWMTTNDTDVLMNQPRLEEAVSKLAQFNFNTIYPVVWNSGYVTYKSSVVKEAGIQPFVRRGFQGQDMLADIIERAHRHNLLVLPWFEFGFMAPPSSELALKHPNWLTQQRDGTKTSISAAGEVVWLNPFHPQVQKFMTDLIVEVVTDYDIDGVQFDDHTSLPSTFGYDPYTISLYQRETNRTPPSNPQDPAWVRWRAHKITAFMRQLHQAIKAKKPHSIISVSPNPYHIAYNGHLQDWVTWVRDGLVDELVVQVYRDELDFFIAELNRPEMKAAQNKISTGVGILTGLRTRPVPINFIQSKVRAARDRQFGVAFFFYESLWDHAAEPHAQRQYSFQSMFPQPAIRASIR
ncbi:glycoside hydrolase family 10 protein [Limnospira sp. PMC 1252.20]|uniref:glycoside hydrolase family 10 protein n=1 Tax=Limnospira sp. PMC 1252.20 TaxID=2981050 RepID=UPI0028E11F9F|nr:glycoside hydrolase family 10 protein [Limnospira sp. PMC 1252.20]MDT9210201.1 glycoside hydrolase family 10 protein [Limnospira sp. PMC 1252.20]